MCFDKPYDFRVNGSHNSMTKCTVQLFTKFRGQYLLVATQQHLVGFHKHVKSKDPLVISMKHFTF